MTKRSFPELYYGDWVEYYVYNREVRYRPQRVRGIVMRVWTGKFGGWLLLVAAHKGIRVRYAGGVKLVDGPKEKSEDRRRAILKNAQKNLDRLEERGLHLVHYKSAARHSRVSS